MGPRRLGRVGISAFRRLLRGAVLPGARTPPSSGSATLADALGVDCRWGAAHFESRLVDHDVASNWGNRTYQAGVGNDSRDGFFDVLLQAEYYDNAEYVRALLPGLEPLPPEHAHRAWTMSENEQVEYGVELGIDCPRPMLDIEARCEEMQ